MENKAQSKIGANPKEISKAHRGIYRTQQCLQIHRLRNFAVEASVKVTITSEDMQKSQWS